MSSALFDPVFGADRVAARLDDASWVAALVAVEVALSRAAAEHGVVPAKDAERIATVAADLKIDPADLGHNLVLAHDRCNNDKSDHLAAEMHLAAWTERNRLHQEELRSRLREAGLPCDWSASASGSGA